MDDFGTANATLDRGEVTEDGEGSSTPSFKSMSKGGPHHLIPIGLLVLVLGLGVYFIRKKRN